MSADHTLAAFAAIAVLSLVGSALWGRFQDRRERRRKRGRQLEQVDLRTGKVTPVVPIDKPVCTYCGGDDFYEGPCGGMSMNILCANPECRHWFNFCGMLGQMDDLHRQEPERERRRLPYNYRNLRMGYNDDDFDPLEDDEPDTPNGCLNGFGGLVVAAAILVGLFVLGVWLFGR